jgi:predicted Zn-dependent protease with MMP-like domain
MKTVQPEDFEKLVERALRSIPKPFRRRLENVAIVVEPDSPNGSLLGLYEGRPLPTRSTGQGFTLPDKITIYQRPHERLARDTKHLEQLVRDTVWHEIAHYFGLDEAEVRRAEERRAWLRAARRLRRSKTSHAKEEWG